MVLLLGIFWVGVYHGSRACQRHFGGTGQLSTKSDILSFQVRELNMVCIDSRAMLRYSGLPFQRVVSGIVMPS